MCFFYCFVSDRCAVFGDLFQNLQFQNQYKMLLFLSLFLYFRHENILFCTTERASCSGIELTVDVVDCSYDDNEIDGIYCSGEISCSFSNFTLHNNCDETLDVKKLDCSGRSACRSMLLSESVHILGCKYAVNIK